MINSIRFRIAALLFTMLLPLLLLEVISGQIREELWRSEVRYLLESHNAVSAATLDEVFTRAAAAAGQTTLWPEIFLTLAAGLFAAIMLVRFIRRCVIAPLNAAREMGPSLKAGIDHRIPEPQGAPDEIRSVIQTLNDMSATVAQHMKKLERACQLAELGHWTINVNSLSVEVSDEMRTMFGFGAGEVVRLDQIRQRVDPADHARYDAALKRAMIDREAVELEFRARDGEGKLRVFRALTGPREGSGTSATPEIYGIIQDLTRWRTQEDLLARSQALLKVAGEAALIGGWRYEGTDSSVYWTEGAETILEGLPALLPSRNAATSDRKPQERNRISRLLARCMEKGDSFDEILHLTAASGKPAHIRVIGEPEHDRAGRIVAARGAFQDVTELISVKSEAARQSAQLKSILEAIDDGFVVLEADWTFAFLNTKALAFLGRSLEDLAGKTIWAVFPEAVDSVFHARCMAAADTRESQSFVEYFRPMKVWLEITVHPTANGLAVSFKDVTDERMRQEHLRLLEAAVARLNDVVMITSADPVDDPDGPRILFVNDAFEKVTGYCRADVIGLTPRLLQGPRTQRRELDRIRDAMTAKKRVRAELINYTRTGDEFWVELEIVPIADSTGTHTHFVAIQRDITDRKRAEEKIKLTEQRFALVSKAGSDVIWDWNLAEDAVWHSDNYEEVFAIPQPPALLTIEEAFDDVSPEDRERVRASLQAAVDGTDDVWRCEYAMIEGRSGPRRLVMDRAFIIRDDKGMAQRVVGGMSDVTRLRALDVKLHEASKLDALGQLTGGVAHDFNNLLTIILGNADLLLDRMEDEKRRDLVASTIEAAERGAKLTSDLLAFARRQPLIPAAIDVNAFVEGSSSLIRRGVHEGIRISYHLSDSRPAAEADPNKLQSALLNLVLNAQDAIGARGNITIETDTVALDEAYAASHADVVPGDYVLIAISDDGAGMPKELIGEAFRPFFTTKAPGKGTGLGLSSTYGFVKQSGGHATIYSEPGVGTTVKLFLPRAETGHRPAAKSESRGSVMGTGEHILVVEDDPALRENVVQQLKRLNYRVTEAEDTDAALECLEACDDIRLLFTDIVMPGSMDGCELAAMVELLWPDLRVMFTSGYSEHAVAGIGLADAGFMLLSKPYRFRDLAEKLTEVFRTPVRRPESHVLLAK